MNRYEQHLDEFGAALAVAARGRVRRTRRRIAALAAVTAAVVVAVLVGLSTTPGGTGDVVGRALAAVSAPDGIVHYRAVESAGKATVGDGDVRIKPSACSSTEPIEVRQATAPLQWRVDYPRLDRPAACGMGRDHRGVRIVGPRVHAYAAGRTTNYYPEIRSATVFSGYAPGSSAEHLPLLAGDRDAMSHPEGPIVALREMLRDGRLTNAGPRTIDGRVIHRLVSERRVANDPRRAVFDVDAETFEPVRFAMAFRMPTVQRGADGRLRSVFDGSWSGVQLDFESFAIEADDAANRRRLAVELPPGTAVKHWTQAGMRRRQAERRAAEARRAPESAAKSRNP